jgi:hypothetical protein
MANQRLQLGLVSGLALVVLGLMAGFGRGSSHPTSDEASNPIETALAQGKPETQSDLKTDTPVPAGASLATVAERPAVSAQAIKLDLATRETVLSCVRGARAFDAFHSPQDFSSLDEVLNGAVEASGSDARREVRVRNVHVKTREGETLRLHFAPGEFADGGETGAKLRMKLFGVDRENLPVPKELPKELDGLAKLGSDQAIARFKAQGEVLLDESTYTQTLKENLSAEIIERGGHIERFQTFLGEKALACDAESGKMTCRCL